MLTMSLFFATQTSCEEVLVNLTLGRFHLPIRSQDNPFTPEPFFAALDIIEQGFSTKVSKNVMLSRQFAPVKHMLI